MSTDLLADLLEAALIEHGNTLRGKKAIRTKADYDNNYRASFTRPENWLLKAQTRLIHAEGNVHTLVGLFDEFKHAYVPRCRRLIAASAVNEALPQTSEEVTGEHWLPSERLSFKRQPTERKVQVVCALSLDMGQHLDAEAVALEAGLVGGGLQRLVLLEDTTFEGSTPRTILSLPAGLDVLEGLTHVCKQAVWREVGGAL